MEWIKTKDSFPKESGNYLITYINSMYKDDRKEVVMASGGKDREGKWHWSNGMGARYEDENVIAWSYLPEPYKSE